MQQRDPVSDLKRQLSAELARITQGYGLVDLSVRMKCSMARVSYARRGKLERISLEALIRMIEAMRHPVEITVLPERPYQTWRRAGGSAQRDVGG